ncbi:Molybdopterin synthase catalytic subunit [Sciurus carolinensis]|uniref:Molybdopterin synthase catalytic subunit n=1 Tax=Sciurus carolinensis TaxID=30640 RepID=A0AA41N553_SCICA|nr:Molybdopterin synthase catalytic subunit [Sciurus carolinensis]
MFQEVLPCEAMVPLPYSGFLLQTGSATDTIIDMLSSAASLHESSFKTPDGLTTRTAFVPVSNHLLRKDMDKVEETSKDIIKFTAEKLSVDDVSQLVVSPLCGAISLFVGTTRNNFEGKKVISLEYEAYLPMAENEIRKICSDIRQKWPVKHIAVFHRLGLVPVSEASIIIAVSSAHRAASLEAVTYAIDTLKARVPIWKKVGQKVASFCHVDMIFLRNSLIKHRE